MTVFDYGSMMVIKDKGEEVGSGRKRDSAINSMIDKADRSPATWPQSLTIVHTDLRASSPATISWPLLLLMYQGPVGPTQHLSSDLL